MATAYLYVEKIKKENVYGMDAHCCNRMVERTT